MPGTPKWTKVQISGSNLEVNSLTSSIAFDGVDVVNDLTKPIVFRDPVTGGWEATSSISYESIVDSPYLNVGNNSATHSVNVPDLPISASIVGNPAPDPEEGIISFPALFKNDTYGGFEQTSSIAFEPTLEYGGFQQSIVNASIRTGSKIEGPDPAETAIFQLPGTAYDPFPITFTGSFTTHTQTTYLDADIGDYIEFLRGMPVGSGITASFQIPIIYTGAIQVQKIYASLRRWFVYSADPGAQEYLDSDEIEVDVTVFSDQYNWGSATLPYSGSFTGSFEIDSTIDEGIAAGERWQLRIRGHENYSIGYQNAPDYLESGPFRFEITGSTATVGSQFTGDLSGSFIGDVFGGYSGSLSGVTLNSIGPDQALKRGDGIIFIENDGTVSTNFTGDAETTMSIRLFPMSTQGIGDSNKSGLSLEFVGDSTLFSGFFEPGSTAGGLELTDGLAQGGTFGLYFEGSNKEAIGIQIDGGQSGIDVVSGQLRLLDGFATNGVDASFGSGGTGTASIDLASKSGLSLSGLAGQDGKLQLSSSLPGNGLQYRDFNDNTIIDLDTSYIITSSGFINFNTVISQGTLAVSQTGTPTTNTQVDVQYNNTPPDNVGIMDFRQGNAFPNNRTITGSVLVAGNLTVISSSNISSIWAADFQTTDPFIELNSGSAITYPFSRDNGGLIIQTSSDAGNTNAKGAAVYYSRGLGANDPTFTEIGWGVTKGGVEWDEQNLFSGNIYTATGSADNGFLSQVRIKTADVPTNNNTYLREANALDSLGTWYIDKDKNPVGSDSNVWIFIMEES